MFLRSVRFRDWKPFTNASFEFPTPTKHKNVVLIGAKNGFGKTSLLEGIILGLYGREGMDVLARAVTTSLDTEKSYDEFMERGLHAQALEQGRNSISVEIVLEDAADRLKLVRKWHFTGQGKHRRDQEDVQIYRGRDEEPIRVPGPRPSREDKDDYFRGLIARKFIPFHLAEFFLFDGERVQHLAKQQKADTVKMGIEGILGVQLLRELQQDLQDYARSRRSGVEQIEDQTLAGVKTQIAEIESRLGPCRQRLAQLESQITPVRQRIEDLTRRLRTMTGGGIENVRELQEEKFRFQRQKDKVEERLAQMVQSDLAFALAGKQLRDQVAAQFRGEIKRSQWLASKTQTREGLNKILTGLESEPPVIEPPLSADQLTVLRERVSKAWESLWHPPPADCAEEERHGYLTEAERGKVVDRLERIEKLGVRELRELLAEHEEASEQIDKLTREIAQVSGVEGRIREVTDELEALRQQEGEGREQIGGLRRQEEADAALLAQKRAEAARYVERHESAQPQLARAAKAEAIAAVISGAIEDLYPRYVEKLAAEMTVIYKQLAHKGLVKKIEIAPNCTVKLLGDRGRDLRSMDASAGEDQIFALSLIAAIAEVSRSRVPIIMDTPLARLDTDHRSKVLRYFAAHAGEQVIFLSQPDEVHGPYLRVIRDRIGKAYHIEFEELGDGVGKAHVREGYFPSEEV